MIPTLTTERLVLRAARGRRLRAVRVAFYVAALGLRGRPASRRAGAWTEFAAAAGGWVLRGFGPFSVTEAPDRAPTSARSASTSLALPRARDRLDGPARRPRAAASPPRPPARVRAWAYATPGLATLVSYIAPGNARSIRLAERLGARSTDAAPHPEDDPCLVYRHPGPEARA